MATLPSSGVGSICVREMGVTPALWHEVGVWPSAGRSHFSTRGGERGRLRPRSGHSRPPPSFTINFLVLDPETPGAFAVPIN